MIALDHTTAIWAVALLYLVLPVNTWVAMSSKRSTSITLWCASGLMGGVGLILIAGRNNFPNLLAYNLANSLFIGSFLLRMHVLCRELGRCRRGRWLLAWAILDALLFALLDAMHLEYPLTLFTRGSQTIAACGFVALTWQLGQRESSHHARAIALVYGALVVILLARFLQSTGTGFPGIYTSPNNRGGVILASLIGMLTAIVGHFSFMGLVLQRTLNDQRKAAALQARQEEIQRQRQKRAHLERQHTLGVLSESLGRELQQPLTAILLHAQMAQDSLRNGTVDADFLPQQLKLIVAACKRASQLIERIRALIRPAPARQEPILLTQLVHEVWELVQQAAYFRQVQVSLPQVQQRFVVMGDKVQLSQVVLSVLHDAIEAMSHAMLRKLSVTLKQSGSDVLLVVQDTGPGLPSEVLSQLDTPFAALWLGGPRMGLSIADHIIAQHRGKLRFCNAPEGGSVVEIQLPLESQLAPTGLAA